MKIETAKQGAAVLLLLALAGCGGGGGGGYDGGGDSGSGATPPAMPPPTSSAPNFNATVRQMVLAGPDETGVSQDLTSEAMQIDDGDDSFADVFR